MSLFRLEDSFGDTGMIVAGVGVDKIFRRQADAEGRTDEKLKTVADPKDLLEPEVTKSAVLNGLANEAARHTRYSAEADRRAEEEKALLKAHIGEVAMADGFGTIGFAAPDASPSGIVPGVDTILDEEHQPEQPL